MAGQVRRSGGKCSSRVEAEHGEYAPALALLMLLDCGHTGNYKQPQSLLQLLLGCHPSGEPFGGNGAIAPWLGCKPRLTFLAPLNSVPSARGGTGQERNQVVTPAMRSHSHQPPPARPALARGRRRQAFQPAPLGRPAGEPGDHACCCWLPRPAHKPRCRPPRCSRGLVAAVVTARRVCRVTPVVGSAAANMAGCWLRLSAGAGSTSGRLSRRYRFHNKSR